MGVHRGLNKCRSFWEFRYLSANHRNCNFRRSYGSFFGPSEPVVARRVIEDARAREEASKLAKLVKNEVGISKRHSGTSKSSQQSRVSESAKQSKPINQVYLNKFGKLLTCHSGLLQMLKH